MAKNKSYIAHREYIARNVELKNGSNTNEFYELENEIIDAIEVVADWRTKNLNYKEDYWKEAIPQTILFILESFDDDAIKVAVNCWENKAVSEIKSKK